MNDKKHIDRLFQEKLKDFEVAPNDSIWESIERELHEKKRKRRVLPLWWRVAGVAAILALLFTVGSLVFNNGPETQTAPPVVTTDNKENPSDTSSKNVPALDKVQDENVAETNLNKERSSSDSSINEIVNQVQNNTTTQASSKIKSDKGEETQDMRAIVNQATNNPENVIAETSTPYGNEGVKSSNLPELNHSNNDNGQNKSETDALTHPDESNANTSIADTQAEENISKLNKENPELETQSIEDALAEANNTDEKEKDEKLNRWNISTNVAPVYFNSLGSGSSIDEQLVNNSKNGEINMSYGISGSYAINEKLKVRVGINRVDLGYRTSNVVLYQSARASVVGNSSKNTEHITFNNKSENISILSRQNLSFASIPEVVATNVNSSLNQEFGYIELPVEIEYAILNKKFGLNVIGGVSTFFLDRNKVYSTVNGEKSLLGEANNINNTSYSANFGLGVNYNVSDKIKLNLEPTFKYQINTFRDTSGDFRPYFIGVYTGLSYKF